MSAISRCLRQDLKRRVARKRSAWRRHLNRSSCRTAWHGRLDECIRENGKRRRRHSVECHAACAGEIVAQYSNGAPDLPEGRICPYKRPEPGRQVEDSAATGREIVTIAR